MYINLGTGVGKEEKMNVPYAHKKVFFFSALKILKHAIKLLFFLFVFWDVLTMLLLAKIVHI